MHVQWGVAPRAPVQSLEGQVRRLGAFGDDQPPRSSNRLAGAETSISGYRSIDPIAGVTNSTRTRANIRVFLGLFGNGKQQRGPSYFAWERNLQRRLGTLVSDYLQSPSIAWKPRTRGTLADSPS